jgi:diaminopimelate epimerase
MLVLLLYTTKFIVVTQAGMRMSSHDGPPNKRCGNSYPIRLGHRCAATLVVAILLADAETVVHTLDTLLEQRPLVHWLVLKRYIFVPNQCFCSTQPLLCASANSRQKQGLYKMCTFVFHTKP